MSVSQQSALDFPEIVLRCFVFGFNSQGLVYH